MRPTPALHSAVIPPASSSGGRVCGSSPTGAEGGAVALDHHRRPSLIGLLYKINRIVQNPPSTQKVREFPQIQDNQTGVTEINTTLYALAGGLRTEKV